MLFGQPQWLPILSLAALPILVHLLARRRQRVVPFSMTRFLEEAALQMQGRRWLRELILVLLRTGAALFVLLMLLRPYAHINLPLPTAPTAIAFVVDNSLSMRSVGTTSLPRPWLQQAIGWCERLAQETNADIAVIAADRSSEPLCAFTTDLRQLHQALAQVRPTFKALDLAAALSAADTLLATRTDAVKHIVVVTDLQSEPFRSLRLPSLSHPITVVDVKPKPQVGNARLTATVHLPLDPNADGSVTATVQNLSHVPLLGAVSLHVAQRLVAKKDVTLLPSAKQPLSFDLPSWAMAASNEHGFVEGKVVWQAKPHYADVLTVDDTMPFRFKSPSKLRFHNAVINGRQFVDAALKATGLDKGQGVSGALIASPPADQLKADELAMAAFVRSGMVLFADNPRSPLWENLRWKAQERTWQKAQSIAWVDESHPLLRSLGTSLQAVRVWKAVALSPQNGEKVLARLEDGTPFLVERFAQFERLPRRIRMNFSAAHLPPARCLIVACGLGGKSSNLPFMPAFVPLLHRLAVYTTLNGAKIFPLEAMDGEARMERLVSLVPPQSESDFRLPSQERVRAALRQMGGTLLTFEQSPSQGLAMTPLKDGSPLCLVLTLLCLLTEGILTALWWRRR